ncbi:hypothetical protein [Corynebacterium kalinowskii]|nr:hypothetical protein [Corynebacterium kalinowskii]
MRVSRDGIEMAGIRIPWNAIEEINVFVERYGRRRIYHTILQLSAQAAASQVAWDDGSEGGRRLAVAVNQDRSVIFFTGRMNVWVDTLQNFLKWAKLECTPNATDLRFESM